MSEAKVELGRRLFYDQRLSLDGTMSCGTCHQQARAFTDGAARSVGVTKELHPRGAMSLAEVIDHYAEGGRTIEGGPLAGVGAESPVVSEFVPGFILSVTERDDLVAFLESLTDESFIRDERFSDP